MGTNNLQITPEVMSQCSEGAKILGLEPAIGPQHQKRAATTGLIDCLPLAVIDPRHLLVARGTWDAEQCGVAVADIIAGESMLIAESPASLVPIWVVTRLVHATAREWDSWKQLDDAAWNSVVALHRRLAGPDELQPLRNVLNNERIRAALCRDLDGELWSTRLPDAFATAAPEGGRGHFQRTLSELEVTRWLDGLDPSTFAGWRSPLEKVLGVLANPPDTATLVNILIAASHKPSGHDSKWTHIDGVGEFSGTAHDERGAPILTARALVRHAASGWNDPWADAVRHMAERGSKYDGRPHVELAGSLAKTGDFKGAFCAALTACFWIYQRNREVPGELQLLCGRLAKDASPDGVWPIVAHNLHAMGVDASQLSN